MTDIVGSRGERERECLIDCVDRGYPQWRPDVWRETVQQLTIPRLDNNCEYIQLIVKSVFCIWVCTADMAEEA